MSCCGNKRNAWMNESIRDKNPKVEEQITQVEMDRPDKIVEYTGDNEISLRGASTGNIYHFKHKGDKLNVHYSDSFAMMAERDIRVSSR